MNTNMKTISQIVTSKKTTQVQAIINFALSNPGSTANEISKATGASVASVFSLKTRGILITDIRAAKYNPTEFYVATRRLSTCSIQERLYQ